MASWSYKHSPNRYILFGSAPSSENLLSPESCPVVKSQVDSKCFTRNNRVLTTELMTKICHRKEFQSFFFVSIKIFFLDAIFSSERMKELWVVCVYMQKMELRYWWEHEEKTRVNRLNEKRSLILWGLGAPIWKINFSSRLLRLSELPRCRERSQTAICCL